SSCFIFQAEDGRRDWSVTGVQTCALPISPAATPSPIVARLNEIVVRGLRDRAISETLDAQGIVPRVMTPGQYREFVAAETEKFRSEERRVGKECRSGWAGSREKNRASRRA